MDTLSRSTRLRFMLSEQVWFVFFRVTCFITMCDSGVVKSKVQCKNEGVDINNGHTIFKGFDVNFKFKDRTRGENV